MKRKVTKKSYFLFTLLLIVLPFCRESLFISLNEVYTGSSETIASITFLRKIFQGFSNSTLFILKWVFTLFFLVLNVFFSSVLISSYFNKRSNTFYFLLGSAIIFSFSLILYLIGYLIGETNFLYRYSRLLAGFLQSPLLFVFSFLLIFIAEFSRKNKEQ